MSVHVQNECADIVTPWLKKPSSTHRDNCHFIFWFCSVVSDCSQGMWNGGRGTGRPVVESLVLLLCRELEMVDTEMLFVWHDHYIVKWLPVRPCGDVFIECVSGAQCLPNLTMPQKFVVCCYGSAVHPAHDQRFGLFYHLGCRQRVYENEGIKRNWIVSHLTAFCQYPSLFIPRPRLQIYVHTVGRSSWTRRNSQ